MVCLMTSFAAKKEEEESALRDLQIGMAGLKEAASNPALLAQLMRDLAVSLGCQFDGLALTLVDGRRHFHADLSLNFVMLCCFVVCVWRKRTGPRNDERSPENDG